MREHVLGQRTALCKPLATRFTQKGFFPCVDSLVHCETAFLRETLVACLTDPWLLPRMGARVDLQTLFRHETLSTFDTAMFFLHILALKLLFIPSARHLCRLVFGARHLCRRPFEDKIAHGSSKTDFNFARTTRICVVKIRKCLCSNYGFEAPIMCSKLLHVLGLQMWGNLLPIIVFYYR